MKFELSLGRIHRPTFGILLAGCAAGFLSAIPYALAVQEGALRRLGVHVPQLLVGQFVISMIVSSAAIAFGLRLQDDLPFRFAWLGRPRASRPYGIGQLALYGCGAGILAFSLIGGLSWVFERLVESSVAKIELARPAAWKGLLASLYGGVNEEVLLRLFLMTAMTAGGMRLGRLLRLSAARAKLWEHGVVWLSIVLAALVFGLGHLPAAVGAGVTLSAGVVVQLLSLNAVAGIVFGWLYWKRGFEFAVVAHVTADLLLHGIAPTFH